MANVDKTLSEVAAQLTANNVILTNFVNGNETDSQTVQGGVLPSLKKVAKDTADEILAQTIDNIAIASAVTYRGRPTAFTDVNNIGPDANGLGVWNFQASADFNMTNSPEAYPGILEVYPAGTGVGTQRYTTQRGTIYIRGLTTTWNASSPSWGEWYNVGMATNTVAFSGDVNSLVTANRYTVTAQATNTPLAYPGVLEVTRYGNGNNTVQQTFKVQSGAAAIMNRIFTRTLNGTAWSAWAESLTTNSVVAIANGGTGGTTSSQALANLGAVPVTGITTNPAVGQVGQLLEAVASSVSIATSTFINIVTLSLTPGVWEVSGAAILTGSTANITAQNVGIGQTSAVDPGFPKALSGTQPALTQVSVNAPTQRILITANTTIYLVGRAVFATGTVTANGFIHALRIR